MSACTPVSLRTAVSIGMRSRSRTQLPRKSVAWGASHSWPTCAPASDRPSVQCSSTSSLRDLVGVVVDEHARDPQREVGLVEREVEHRVERRRCPARPRRRAAGGRAARGARGSRRSRTCPSAGRRSRGCRPRSLRPGRATPGSAYAARRSSSDCAISAANSGLMLIGNGSAIVNANVSGRGRHLRPHLRAAASQPASLSSTCIRCVPAGDVEQRAVRERHAGARLQLVHVGDAALLARRDRDDAAADLAHHVEQRLELGALGEAARHRLAVDAAVRDREAGREPGRAGEHRLAQDGLHAARSRRRSRSRS